jgi:hypothetical protein
MAQASAKSGWLSLMAFHKFKGAMAARQQDAPTTAFQAPGFEDENTNVNIGDKLSLYSVDAEGYLSSEGYEKYSLQPK